MRPYPLLALLALACGEGDSGTETAPHPTIRFESAETRALESVADITAFKVYGWESTPAGEARIFSGTTVSRGTADRLWQYQPIQYWKATAQYRFLALATSAAANTGLTAAPAPNFTAWEQAATVSLTLSPPYSEDIVYATAERQTPAFFTAPEPVRLSFRHALAQLRVRVRAAAIDDCHIRLRSVSFRPASVACTFTPQLLLTETVVPPATMYGQPDTIVSRDIRLTVASTTPPDDSFTLTLLPDNPQGHTTPHVSAPMLLVPGEMGTVTVVYELWQNSPESMVYSRTDTYRTTGLMQSGRSYRANIVIPAATTVISLQSDLEPWGDDNDTDREILSI